MAERRGEAAPALRQASDPAQDAGKALARAIGDVLARDELARLAVPGGSALAALSFARDRLGEGWRRVALTWIDERCVPEADPESNRGAARRLGLLEGPSPARRLTLYEDDETPDQAVARVSAGLRDDFAGRLDVLLLGLGEDGHIASLFPSRAAPVSGWVAHVSDSPKPPSDRITLTRALLRTARATLLLATGEPKRTALTRLVGGDPTLPAHGLPGLEIFTDLSIDPDPAAIQETQPRS